MKKKTARSKKSKRSGDLRTRAERLLRESPERHEALPQEDLKSLIHELQVHQIELEMQNEELRRAQAELEESRNRYFELFDLAPVGYFTMETNGLVLQTNLTGALLLGTERKNLEKRPFSRFVHPDDHRIFFSHIRALLKTQTEQTCELRLVTKDDTTLYGRMESVPVRNGEGDVISIRTALLNVTRQKQAELALKESEERFRLIAETSVDIIFQIDPRGVILYCSPSIERIFGYTPAEVRGTPFENYLSPSDVLEARKNFQRMIFGEKITFFELNIQSKSGTPVPLEINASPLFRDGETKYIFGISRDVTERKRAEEALKRREEHLRVAVEGGNLGTWERDLIIGNVVWNDYLYGLFGRDPSRPITGETFFEYIHKDDRPRIREYLERADRGKTDFSDEFRIIREDGQVRWLAAFGRIYRDHTGQPIRMAGVNLDITDRKEAEESLKKSQEFAQKILKSALSGLYIHDLKKGINAFINPAYTRLTGYTLDDNRSMSRSEFFALFHPEDRAKVAAHIDAVTRAGDGEILDIECRFKTADGRWIWVFASDSVFARDDDGHVRELIGSFLDITERKRAEQELQESEEKAFRQLGELEAIYDSAPVGLCVFDRDFRYVRINERLAEMNGISAKEHIGHTPWEVVPDLALASEPIFRQILDTGEPLWDVEFNGMTPAEPGVVRFWNEHWLPMKDAAGHVIGVNVVAEEVTERKRIEEELRKSRDQLENRVQERTAELTESNEALRSEVAKRKRYEGALRGATKKILLESKRRRFLSGSLVETLERDRREVAMYLHDQIGQMLATVKMDLEMARKGPAQDNGLLEDKLRGAEEMVRRLMSHVKDISRKLRPDILDTLGLIPALRSLVESFRSESGLRVHFYYREPSQEIDPDKSLSLYRITQEALNNVAKYAQATNVFVNLILKDDSLQLTVEDDGIGFNYEAMRKDASGKGPLGIMIMKERAVLAGGEVIVESEIGKGTHVVAEIPMD